MDLGADHSEGLGAGIDVVQARFCSSDVPSKFLINAVVGLGNCFVWVVYATAAGDPRSQTSTTLSPAMKTITVAGYLCEVLVVFW